MAILKHFLKERKIEMSLVLKAALQCLFFLAEIVAGASLYVDENSG
jgi:hypothetical protein